MVTRISYIALGFIIGAGVFFAVMSTGNESTSIAKTGRLSPVVAPTNFVMERFAG
jgi:hypothetical protein